MNWQAWKLGLFVALLTGLFTAFIGAEAFDSVHWSKFIFFLLVCIGKDALLFLKDHPPEKIDRQIPLLSILFALLFVAPGCAFMRSEQTETSPDGTTRKTVLKVRTIWDSQSDLAKLRATMTDKQQALSVAGLSESSSGSNAVAVVESAVGAAVRAAVGAAK